MLDFPVACWRDGAKHHPVVASIPMPTHEWRHRTPRPTMRIDTAQIIQDLNPLQEPDQFKAELTLCGIRNQTLMTWSESCCRPRSPTIQSINKLRRNRHSH